VEKNFPSKRSNSKEISDFLQQAKSLPQTRSSGGRLLFALDATASRQASWDRACDLQAKMFLATEKLGGLSVKLCYYRGYQEFEASEWCANSHALLNQMLGVSCLGGYTQIAKVLDLAIKETREKTVNAVVIVSDAMEENIDKLCQQAGQLGILNTPLFLFQEGVDPSVSQAYRQMAQLSNGAYCRFNENSAQELEELLSVVARYASGGKASLKEIGHVKSSSAQALLQQLK